MFCKESLLGAVCFVHDLFAFSEKTENKVNVLLNFKKYF